jgi:hypothetical protein
VADKKNGIGDREGYFSFDFDFDPKAWIISLYSSELMSLLKKLIGF